MDVPEQRYPLTREIADSSRRNLRSVLTQEPSHLDHDFNVQWEEEVGQTDGGLCSDPFAFFAKTKTHIPGPLQQLCGFGCHSRCKQ